MASKTFEQFCQKMQELADINHTVAALHWDQEVCMPRQGSDTRARQIASLSGLYHRTFTSDVVGELLDKLDGKRSLSEREQRNIEEVRRDYEKQRKFPNEFVVNLSEATSKAFNAWKDAKAEKQFKQFAPALETVVRMKQEAAEIIGYDDHPYDALLDEFEPYARTKDIEAVFDEARSQLVAFVEELQQQPPVEDSFLRQKFNKQKQWDFGIHVLHQMGYDFERGRQDLAPHPFTISFGPGDVRVTTRIREDDFKEMLWSTIHEGGHALYEQGLPAAQYGLPLGEAVSLAIHESQSRLWENNVGRSRSFCKAFYPTLKAFFPGQLNRISEDKFYRAINAVQPSLIRTAADELTYHLHILIRFELEQALIEKQLAVKDLAVAWNDKYKTYLGMEVPDDAQGVLQDVHWSHGSIGYFPTYSLGSFYAAQFFAKAQSEISGLESKLASGDMQPLLRWLRKNIHRHGRHYPAQTLCERITGEPLNFRYFMDYAREKFGAVYGVKQTVKV